MCFGVKSEIIYCMHEACVDLANISYVRTTKPYILISNTEWTYILVVANHLKSVFLLKKLILLFSKDTLHLLKGPCYNEDWNNGCWKFSFAITGI